MSADVFESPFAGKVPAEFARVMASEEFYTCPICGAVVTEQRVQLHADWHSGERMRNFSAF